MRVLKRTYRRALAILFIASMIGPFPALRAQSQPGQPVIITFGQPNIWSLEQAHYLLARMRAQALRLQSKEFAAGDLDPNEVNSTRLNALKELLGIGVGFNQGIGFQNDQAKKELTFNQDRRHTLLEQRDARQAELRTVNDQLGTLRVERERMNQSASTTDAEKKTKDVEIEQKIQQQTQLNGEIQSLTSEINGITSTSTALSSPSPPSPVSSPMADSIVDTLVKGSDFQKQLSNLPKLSASNKLDNYLNLQYELIAKQLSQLRDEVGPGQRLVFVELPQSFYTVPDKANRMVAQVWWRVDKYYERLEKVNASDETNNSQKQNKVNAQLELDSDCIDDQPHDEIKANPRAWERRQKCNPYSIADRPRSEDDIKSAIAIVNKTSQSQTLTAEDKRILNEWHGEPAGSRARTLDLIPRQSALNVNDIQDKQRNFNLMGLFSWLSGLGVSINYQRQREVYEQFLQQEVYASAFGKGTPDFGWTFGPKPGTERIAPGLQNTFAVLVVPENAYALTLKATGCYFPRTAYAPADFDGATKCGNTPTDFHLVIPSTTQNNFWVTGLQYRPVRPGQRILVNVYGDYFSPQIGVLVNGVALRHSIGLAQSELAVSRTDSSFEPAPAGDFEFVNSKQLVLGFSLGDFKGTPTITLVTPGRARVINNLRLVINDSYKCTKADDPKATFRLCPGATNAINPDPNKPRPVLYKKLQIELEHPGAVLEKDSIWVKLDSQPPMFSEVAPAPVLAIDNLTVLDSGGQKFVAHLTGSKFDKDDQVFVNSSKITPELLAPGLFKITFDATESHTLEVTVIHKGEKDEETTYATKSFPNPTLARVDKVSITHYKADAKPKPILGVSLEGVGFNHFSDVQVPGARVLNRATSPTRMTFDILLYTPDDRIVVLLTDPRAKLPVSVVVERPIEPGEGKKDDESASETKPTKPGRTPKPRRKPHSPTKPSTYASPPQTKP